MLKVLIQRRLQSFLVDSNCWSDDFDSNRKIFHLPGSYSKTNGLDSERLFGKVFPASFELEMDKMQQLQL
jgi:hypothetical protein